MPNQQMNNDNIGRPVTARRRGVLLNQNLLNIVKPMPRQGNELQQCLGQVSDPDLPIKTAATAMHQRSSNKRPADPHDALAQAQNAHKKTRQSTITAALENSMFAVCGVKSLSQHTGTSGKDHHYQTTKKDLNKSNNSSRKYQQVKFPEITQLIEKRIKSISLNGNENSSLHAKQQNANNDSITSNISLRNDLGTHHECLEELDDTDEVEILEEVRPEQKQLEQQQENISKTRDQTKQSKSLLSYYKTPLKLIENPHIKDHDKTQLKDSHSEPHYAWDIFEYYRCREKSYLTEKYLNKHKPSEINAEMRAVLVDWMVEIQESFEMNHETLYLAVKIMDRYLMKKPIKKTTFQLLGVTSLLIAAKFDERIPPAITDFVYTADSACTKQQVIKFEIEVLKTLDFFIGFPLSYRFLRRFARCCDCDFHTLTLARFILETSLMEYDLICEHESKLAAAALFLAIEMLHLGSWTETFEFYTGYSEEDLLPLMWKLNDMIAAPKKEHLATIRTKYEHHAFMQVAKIKPLPPQ
ncbi:G2/mitotic-specific cyclin-B3, partial [Fragariocoptes setiger]